MLGSLDEVVNCSMNDSVLILPVAKRDRFVVLVEGHEEGLQGQA